MTRFISIIVMVQFMLIPTVIHAYTTEQILCSCTKFTEYYTGVQFPEFVSTSDERVRAGIPPKNSVALLWQPLYSTWHVGVSIATTTEGFWMLSTNAHGCGLTVDYFKYSDPLYAGYWYEK